MLRIAFKCLLATTVFSGASTATAADISWIGKSNAGGGEVLFGYHVSPEDPEFDPELSESGGLTIRCDGFDGRLTISFDADYDIEGGNAQKAFFVIGRDSFERDGVLGAGGLYMATPVVQTNRDDPLIQAILLAARESNETELKIHVARVTEDPDFVAPLNGNGKLFSEHLRACL